MRKRSLLVIAIAVALLLTTPVTHTFAATNNPLNAPAISIGQMVTDTVTVKKTDNDSYSYYKFRTTSDSGIKYYLKLAVLNITGDGGITWCAANILDSNYNVIPDTRGDWGIWGRNEVEIGEAASKEFVLSPNTEYYIQVNGCTTGYANSRTYNYSVGIGTKVETPSSPSVVLKAGKKKITVSYKRVKNCTRYQIRIKQKGGKYKQYNNGSSLKKTFTKLKKGKNYYVQVRAQRCVGGKWYSSAWSKAKVVKVK